MTRFVPVTVLVVLLAASGVARGQVAGTTLPNSATIVYEHRKIYDDSANNGSFIEPTDGTAQLRHYFNLAHCNCAQANVSMPSNTEGWFSYVVRETAQSGLHVPVTFLAGTSCDDPTHRAGGSAPSCTPDAIGTVNDLDANLYPGGSTQSFNLYQVVNANQNTVPCLQLDNPNTSIFALAATMGGTTFDFSSAQPVGGLSTDTTSGDGVDTKPPPAPTNIRAVGGDGTIHVTWDAPTSNNTDVTYYQVLCANVDDSPARATRSDDPQYVTTTALCGAAGDPALAAQAIDAGPMDQPVAMPTGPFGDLDDSYICGTANSGTATSLDVGDLQNKVPYKLIVLSIDLHGNYSATYLTSTVTPINSIDFWEDLHGDPYDSHAQGGLCLLAETYGDDSALTGALRAFRDDTLGGSRAGRWLTDAYYATAARLGAYVHGSTMLRIIAGVVLAPSVALALLWHWLTLPGLLALVASLWLVRRRWRDLVRRGLARLSPRTAGLGAALALLGLAGSRAHAGGYQPYWEDSNTIGQDNQNTEEQPGEVHWLVGVRIGPYVPDIDSQFSTKPGPYAQMFGGYHILPMLDVDRVLWSGFGQVGVGLSLGYMQKTGRTFVDGSLVTDNPRARASDHNAFQLIPIEATAVYRLTWLDDNYGIPVVPYARAGLAYYVWWISVEGHYARVCSDGMQTNKEPGCSTNKALGASAGVTGAIGLALRAERIDASAAMSMQQSGIQHAGIYAELSLAKVDGFGSDTKLSVGDTTWFAGVDFEF